MLVKQTTIPALVVLFLTAFSCGGSSSTPAPASPAPAAGAAEQGTLHDPREVHLKDVVQLTRDSGENAEAYWSKDGQELIFQTARPPFGCDQIMRVPADGSADPVLVSTGKGRTTCAYFTYVDDRIIYSSTHESSPECPPAPDHSQGYVWALYESYDIYRAKPDGSELEKLTDTPGYDAEATVCPVDGSIIFTSMRDGDLELYRMDKDGKNVLRLTNAPGYDGGAFFNSDCTKIVWRASRPEGEARADYDRLLKQGLIRPSKLELFVANADGSNPVQVTKLGAASFGPYFHPSGERILFSTNHPEPRGREFNIWAVNVDGSGLEQITYTEGFDGFPVFSPDGTKFAFGSNRNQAKEGETDIFVATWVDNPPKSDEEASAAEVYQKEVEWLADDAREGRGIGTRGIDEAADWIGKRYQELGLEGAFAGSFKQALDVPIDVEIEKSTAVTIGRQRLGAGDFVPASFSSNGSVRGRTVYVDYGIVAKELGVDDYAGRKVKGKIAVIRRFTSGANAFEKEEVSRRYSDLHYKAFTAREHGAIGVIFIDWPNMQKTVKGGGKRPEEAPLPGLAVGLLKNVGIPAVVVKRSVGAKLVKGSSPVTMNVKLDTVVKSSHNVGGVLRAGAENKLPGVIVIGAHYDHLGHGGESSLEPGVKGVHNGADDNASGTAGLLAIARQLRKNQDKLRRDVYFLAFTAEETGLLGSSFFTRSKALAMKDVVAMLNMDMIGRMRGGKLSVLGGATATEWTEIVEPACQAAGLACSLGGDGYGPSDQTPFYAAGVPVLHFFTGAHVDYHKTSDDAEHINAVGGVRVASVVAAVAETIAGRDNRLSYQRVAPPAPRGDRRSYGASMGTIPDYTGGGDGKPGVSLSGVRPGGPADKAGIRGGDRIVKIGITEVRSVHDLMYVLRGAKPGERVPVVVERGPEKVTVKLTFGKSRRRMR